MHAPAPTTVGTAAAAACCPPRESRSACAVCAAVRHVRRVNGKPERMLAAPLVPAAEHGRLRQRVKARKR